VPFWIIKDYTRAIYIYVVTAHSFWICTW